MTVAVAAGAPVLACEGLGHAYPDGRLVFTDMALQVRPREIVALLGASGCGKSTLLRSLAGLVPPLQGRIEMLGEPLNGPHPRAALLFQQPGLLPWLSVARNVGFGLDFSHQPAMARSERQSRIDHALYAVGLARHHHLRPAQLSGGMAQRVALARALAREPRLLLADEPFSALDALTRADMQSLLVEVVRRRDTAVLLVTHDIDEAILVADRIVLMGSSVADQPARALQSWTVDLPRPRNDHPARIAEMRLDILNALHHPATSTGRAAATAH